MENYKRLFKDAERLKPGESMWNRIASEAAKDAKSSGAAGAAEGGKAPGSSGSAAPRKPGSLSVSAPASPAMFPAREDVREARPWRLAASLAVGLGMVAALAVLFREPPGMAAREGSETSATRQLATADAEPAAEGLQEWHADLGIPAGERFEEMSAEGWGDDTALFNPLLEE